LHLDKIHFGGKRRRSDVGDLDAKNGQKMPCSSEACTGERCMDCNPLMKLEKLARSAAERSGIKTTEFSSVEDLLGISLAAYFWYLFNTLPDGRIMSEHGAKFDVSHEIGIKMKGSGAGGAPTMEDVLKRLNFLNTGMISKEQHGIVSHMAQLNKQASTLDAEAYFRDTHKHAHAVDEKFARDCHAALVLKHTQLAGADEPLDVVASLIALAKPLMERLKLGKAVVILQELAARGPRQSANEANERLRHAGVVTKLAQALVRLHDFTEAASQLSGALDELEASSRTAAAAHPVTQVVRTVLGSTLLHLSGPSSGGGGALQDCTQAPPRERRLGSCRHHQSISFQALSTPKGSVPKPRGSSCKIGSRCPSRPSTSRSCAPAVHRAAVVLVH
jgi:hypothetical protein